MKVEYSDSFFLLLTLIFQLINWKKYTILHGVWSLGVYNNKYNNNISFYTKKRNLIDYYRDMQNLNKRFKSLVLFFILFFQGIYKGNKKEQVGKW